MVQTSKFVGGNMSFSDGTYDMKTKAQEGFVLVFISQDVKRKCK